MSSPGYERILAAIRRARQALGRARMARAAGRILMVGGAVVVALALLDNLFRLPAWARIVLLPGGAAVWGIATVLEVRRLLRADASDDAVAVRIEQSSGVSDNSLINALQLGREKPAGGLAGAIVQSVVTKGAAVAGRVRPSRVVDLRRVRRSLLLGAVAVLAVVAYAAVFGDHFRNAVARYARPTAFVPPVSSTLLEVSPGDAAVMRGEDLTVRIERVDPLPSTARILAGRDGDLEPSEMRFDGRSFSFRYESVDAPFEYRVEANDASTRIHRVSVIDPPAVKRLDLTYRYPDYLGLPERKVEDAGGEIRAIVGTRVLVTAAFNQPIRSARLQVGDGRAAGMLLAGDGLTGSREITVRATDVWRIRAETRDGLGTPNPPRRRIVALPDEPPVVEVLRPDADVTVTLPARVPVVVRARDDFGLAGIDLVVRRADGGAVEGLGRSWSIDSGTERTVRHEIAIPAGSLAPGDVLVGRAEARDRNPARERPARSRTFSIRIRSDAQRAAAAEAALADLATRLRELLERERGIRRDTGALRSAVVGNELPLSGLPARATSLGEAQARVGAEMTALAGTVPKGVPALKEVRGSLRSLAVNEVLRAVRRIHDSRTRAGVVAAARDLESAEAAEREIVAKLEELLGLVESLVTRMAEDPDAWLDEKMDEGDREAALEDAIARLKKFVRDQREVLRLTRELEKKDVDDFTEEDEKLLEKLAAQESELARFLEDLKDDLSKVPDQDFSNSELLAELIEAYGEVEMAADALGRKAIELAVPLEQSGLELAEGLTENIEKWLADVPDRIKWNMEEFDGEYPDVPMAELPEQLEDLIGELMESEEDLGEEFDDVTSGWADSLDEGAGWGVADGPISNMSAQGKTGNVLPNSSEIGGRSGEGRTGRSHGEMVEAEATGKGGRKTPTRLTPDAWEGKSVEDSSTDPLGGATGGGKLAGGAAGGLRGPLPPAVKQDLGRLAGKQAEIRQRAEEIDRALTKLACPDGELERSIVLMKEMEEALRTGDPSGFSRRHGILVEQMKESRKVLREHATVLRDRSRAVPKEILEEVESVDLSSLPEGYRKLLREYYKILSRGGTR